MNRNVESHFANVPQADIPRSIFDRSHGHKTSFNIGQVIPIYVDEVLPGDSFKMQTSKVVRLQTMLTPILDNIYLDTYYFFVPMRLVWSHAKEFFGENSAGAWAPETEYNIPIITSPENGFNTGTLADYFGLPVGVEWTSDAPNAPSALPFRAYSLIIDQFFRDQNLQDPLNTPIGDATQLGTNSGYDDSLAACANGGLPFVAAKYHDYFTSALPAPQKGDPVRASATNGMAPVYALNTGVPTSKYSPGPLISKTYTSSVSDYLKLYRGIGGATITGQTLQFNAFVKDNTAGDNVSDAFDGVKNSNLVVRPVNLWADVSDATFTTINELRMAFQLQKFLERQARGGSRYIEVIRSFFGVTSPDARLQRPEYLGGNRISLAIHEVTNSAQSENDFLGDLGAKSATSDVNMDFEKSFTEHGFLIGLCVARYDHTYSQGIEKFWLRRAFTDYYWPVFASIGEVPIEKCELYADSTTMANKGTFGYQEAWADYRYKPSRVSGEMRPQAANTLASWHLADNYSQMPTLSSGWIQEDKTNVDRVLAVTSTNANQIFGDFYFKVIATRPMPVYSVPGLIDHF